MDKHHHPAVWVMVIAHQAVGFFWYSSAVFGSLWLAAQGKTEADIDPTNPEPFIVSIAATVIACYGISWLARITGADTMKKGAILGGILAIAFVYPAIAPHYAFLGMADSLLWIDLSVSMIMTLITTVVLAVWRPRGSA